MRIALVHHFVGGSTRTSERVFDLARFLGARGDDVEIVSDTQTTAPHARVTVRRVGASGFSAGARLRSFAARAAEHVTRTTPDVVYGFGTSTSHTALRLADGVTETRLALCDAEERTRWQQRLGLAASAASARIALEARALERGRYELVSVASEMVGKDAMKRYGIYPELMRLSNDGVDLERFHPRSRATSGTALRRELGLSATDVVVLFAGSGWMRHGLDRLLKIWPQFAAERQSARLLVLGDDARAAQLRVISAQLSSVRFLGARTDREACFAAADLFAQPSRYDAFAVEALEALASGVPIVTTTWNGACELVEEDQNGVALFGDDIRQTLYRALVTWTRPERRQQGGLVARTVAERHSRTESLRAEAAVIDEAAALRRAASAR